MSSVTKASAYRDSILRQHKYTIVWYWPFPGEKLAKLQGSMTLVSVVIL